MMKAIGQEATGQAALEPGADLTQNLPQVPFHLRQGPQASDVRRQSGEG